MDRFLKTAELKDLAKKVSQGKITYSKMVEQINLNAYVYYNSLKSRSHLCSCEKPKHNYPEMVWCDNCGNEITKIKTK